MKILHINASYKPAFIYGGPTVSVAKLCEELFRVKSGKLKTGFDSAQPYNNSVEAEIAHSKNVVRQDIQVSVYTTLANGKEELPYQNGEVRNVNGVTVHYFKRLTKDHSHLSPLLLWHLWKNVKSFDIIHIHAWWNLVSVGAALICLLKRKRYVLSPRGTLSNYSFYNRKSIVKRIFHRTVGKPLLKAAIFQVSSSKEKNDIEKILGTSCQISVIPNFVELKKAWETNFNFTGHPKAEFLFFSRIEEKKGLEFLLKACALLNIPYHLTIAGSGEDAYVSELKKLSSSLGIENETTWLGQVPSQNKFTILAQYDLLILPSYDENFANVVIESLACGTPVLISPNVGLADYVAEKDLGWVCQQNPESIVATLEMIYTDRRQELQNKRSKAINTIKRDFSEDALRATYIQFYESIKNEPI